LEKGWGDLMSDDVKTRILRAAKKLFAIHGFDGTSVRQICEEAGANVALVSYHFGGKEKLLGTLYAQVFPTPDENGLMDKIADPIVRLKTMITGYLTVMNDNQEIVRIVQMENLLQTERVEEMRQYTKPYWTRWRQTLEEGREQGRMTFDSIDTAMLQTMGAVIYPLTHTFVDPMLMGDKQSIEEQIRQRTEFVLRGLGADPKDIEGIVLMQNRRVIPEK
jgi:TetR/AcrR family transcriptional regulator, upper aerobic nicotinate degradation pathway regulator